MDEDACDIDLIERICEAHGLRFKRIPEAARGSHEKRADGIIYGDSSSYLIESKSFNGMRLEWHAVPGESYSEAVKAVGPLSKIRSAWSKAIDQFDGTIRAGCSADFNIIWMITDPRIGIEFVKATLYGIQTKQQFINLATRKEIWPNIYYAKPALFASHTSHYVDAVVLLEHEGSTATLRMFVNTFGKNAQQLSTSQLGRIFSEYGQLINPFSFQQPREAIIIDEMDIKRELETNSDGRKVLNPEILDWLNRKMQGWQMEVNLDYVDYRRNGPFPDTKE